MTESEKDIDLTDPNILLEFQRNSVLINATDDLIFSIDKNFNVTAANKSYLEFNQPAAKNPPFAIGDNVFDDLNYDSEQKSIWLNLYTRALRGESFVEELYFKIPQYNIDIYTQNSFKPLYIDNEISGVVVYIKNISSGKKVAIELIKSEKRFRALFEQHTAVMLLIDPLTGKIVDANESAVKFYGYTFDVLCSLNLADLSYTERTVEEDQPSIYSTWDPKKDAFIFSHQLASGEVRTVEVHSSYIEDSNKVVLFFIVLDITNQKKAEKNLIKSNKELQIKTVELTNSNSELERFVFVASHDLQEPLRIVSSYLQLFEAKYHDQVDETGKKYIEFAVDAAERMKTLIRDLLQYSRIGAESLELIDVDMNEVIKDVLILLHNEITETNTQIVNETLPIIKAGKTAMLQLLQNLIGNAIKFRSSQTPIIKITAEEKEKEWLFSIKDNGIGIDPQYAEKIFIVFQRLHTTNEYKGTGIGLSICSKIMERYHGKIWVESELGKGATFHFMMPKPKD